MTAALGDARALPLADSSVDAVVCDPPYELGFMGRSWDSSGVAFQPETWAEALRVAKPGAYLLAFGGTRTYHRLTCAVEDAGWIVEDSIGVLGWVHAQGFPKGKNKLKPAWEPIVLARKAGPSVLGVDACRIPGKWTTWQAQRGDPIPASVPGGIYGNGDGLPSHVAAEHPAGRWPTNLVFVHHPDCADRCVPGGCHVAELDAQSGTSRSSANPDRFKGQRKFNGSTYAGDAYSLAMESGTATVYGDSGGASRFYPVFRFNEQDRSTPCCMLSGWRTETAGIAESPSATMPATTGPTARASATTRPDASTVQRVASAGSLCVSCATAIAQSVAATSVDRDPASILGLGSTTGSEKRILSLSLALCAEALARPDTTSTTAELSTSLGSVVSVISACTTRASASPTRRSGQSPPVFRFEAKAPTKERPVIVRDGETIRHPTVKPVSLMRWLVRLVTPPGGTVLDPFCGSGATLEAALCEGFDVLGFDTDPDSVALTEQRLSRPIAAALG